MAFLRSLAVRTAGLRCGWETHWDVFSIAAAGTKKDGRVAGAISTPPLPFTHPRSLNVSTSPVWLEVLFYLNSLPVTRIVYAMFSGQNKAGEAGGEMGFPQSPPRSKTWK